LARRMKRSVLSERLASADIACCRVVRRPKMFLGDDLKTYSVDRCEHNALLGRFLRGELLDDAACTGHQNAVRYIQDFR
jgi:hypothetical protein